MTLRDLWLVLEHHLREVDHTSIVKFSLGDLMVRAAAAPELGGLHPVGLTALALSMNLVSADQMSAEPRGAVVVRRPGSGVVFALRYEDEVRRGPATTSPPQSLSTHWRPALRTDTLVAALVPAGHAAQGPPDAADADEL